MFAANGKMLPMGILDRLRRKPRVVEQPQAAPSVRLLGGDIDIEIVGESFNQDALWRIAGVKRGQPVRHRTVAVLVPEPHNPYDSNAIRVDIDGLQVGHLSASNAVRYGPGLRALMDRYRSYIALNAVVVGGGHGREHLGVWLSHDPSEFGLSPRVTPPATTRPAATGGAIRTGFSEARVTDLEDDSYDLSWHNELPDDDIAAVRRLRELLAVDPDPIDRHYMFTELESRLYRSGADDEKTLSEFEVVCRSHHAEIGTMRSAFVAKWGVVPLLNTYRQMSIREQKAKDWESMKWWAEQGIDAYDGKAARAEWVTDLEKRRDRAVTKIKARDQPSVPRMAKATPAERSVQPSMTETLTCQRCGDEFERVRTRGRKPLTCPNCR
jgi:hypothetical protein